MERIRNIYVVMALGVGQTQAQQSWLDSCMIGYYPFNGSATDMSGSGLDGINYGALPANDRFGNPVAAFHFDGTVYIELPTTFDLPERSICAWFNADTITPLVRNFYDSDCCGITNGNTILGVIYEDGAEAVRYQAGHDTANRHLEPVSAGEWHMATITVSASATRYYLDCQMVADLDTYWGASNDGVTGVKIGCSRLLDRFFIGTIDDVRAFACELGPEDVCTVYNNLNLAVHDGSPSLKGALTFTQEHDQITLRGDHANVVDKRIVASNGAAVRHVPPGRSAVPINGLPSGSYILICSHADGGTDTRWRFMIP